MWWWEWTHIKARTGEGEPDPSLGSRLSAWPSQTGRQWSFHQTFPHSVKSARDFPRKFSKDTMCDLQHNSEEASKAESSTEPYGFGLKEQQQKAQGYLAGSLISTQCSWSGYCVQGKAESAIWRVLITSHICSYKVSIGEQFWGHSVWNLTHLDFIPPRVSYELGCLWHVIYPLWAPCPHL